MVFLLHLATHFKKPVEEVLNWSAFTSNLLKAYYDVYPWGYEIEDLRMGIVASTVANSGLTDKVRPPKDFMIDLTGKEAELPSLEELERKADIMRVNLQKWHANKP